MMDESKITKNVVVPMFLFLIVLLVLMITNLIVYKYAVKPQCQSKYSLLDDLQYMDSNKLIFVVDDERYVDSIKKDVYVIGENIEIETCVYPR